jgi:hypothetical protein
MTVSGLSLGQGLVEVGDQVLCSLDAAADPVPLEYSIEWLTCAVASRFDAAMVG